MQTTPERDRYYYMLADHDHGSSWADASSKLVLSFLTSSGADMLEVGCGTATVIPHLPPTWTYTGVDVSEYALERARTNFPHASFVRTEASTLPFPDATFDAVLSVHAVEHFEHPRAALNEMIRVLKPGGRGVLIGPNLDFPLSLPNAVRQWSPWRRFLLRCRRIADYAVRITGGFTFRTVYPNFTEETGRYELPDDDLRYIISAEEVARYLSSHGAEVIRNQDSVSVKVIPAVKRAIRVMPGMSMYGAGMRLFFQKTPL